MKSLTSKISFSKPDFHKPILSDFLIVVRKKIPRVQSLVFKNKNLQTTWRFFLSLRNEKCLADTPYFKISGSQSLVVISSTLIFILKYIMGQFFAQFITCNDITFRLREIEVFLLPRCRKKGNLSGNN